MTISEKENEFLSKIREESTREREARKAPTRRPRYWRKISLFLAWTLVVLGLTIGALFLFSMESAHGTFAPLAENGIVSVINEEGFSDYFKQLALDWLPMFFKVYDIRYLILLVELAFFGGLSAVFFLLSRPNKKVSSS